MQKRVRGKGINGEQRKKGKGKNGENRRSGKEKRGKGEEGKGIWGKRGMFTVLLCAHL